MENEDRKFGKVSSSTEAGSESTKDDRCAAEKRFTGLGLIFGAISGMLYATFSLFVRLMSNEVNAVMITWIRAIESFVIMLPLVVKKKGENIFGRSTKEFLILILIVVMSSINTVVVSTSLQLIHLGDVLTILALAPTLIVILNCLLFCKMCRLIDTLIVVMCMVGVILCIQPSFIFGVNLRHDSKFFAGYTLSCVAAITRSVSFIAVGHLRDLNTYVKVFWSNAALLIPTTCYLLATDSFELPSSLKANIYLFVSGILALFGLTSLITGTYFDSPLMVSIGRTCDVPLSFIFDVVIFGDALEILPIVGAVLILLCIIVPATLKLRRMI